TRTLMLGTDARCQIGEGIGTGNVVGHLGFQKIIERKTGHPPGPALAAAPAALALPPALGAGCCAWAARLAAPRSATWAFGEQIRLPHAFRYSPAGDPDVF